MLEHRQEEHDSQKNQKAEEDKELHGVAVGTALVLPFSPRTGENERLISIAEGLGEHHHHDGNLDVRPVYAHHIPRSLFLTLEEIRNHDLPHVLAQYTGHAENQQRPTVAQHTTQKSAPEPPSPA